MQGDREAMWRRWSEVDALFEQALERPPAERTTWLAEACGADAELGELVRSLLSAAEESDVSLSPPSELLRDAFTNLEGGEGPSSSLAPGDVVDRYRIVRELGRGGMAIVYEAERADGVFDQRVALKVLESGPGGAEAIRRFAAERQILSGLVHPNIAHLLDGGATPDGRPYLVMEKVEGEPITRWADARRLGLAERLDLFAQVADAVSYAHARLVVHRDIKPANVMVDEDGRAKLLDFGIAKLLDVTEDTGEGGGDDATAAAPATRLMTPQYASPEQILGRPVTTASDVHGLGVLLYELLTGHRPFGGDATAGFELQKAICETAPTRPSTVVGHTVERSAATRRPDITPASVGRARGVEPGVLRRRLRGDLDAVVLKALRKEPEERYRTVEAFVDDIQLYLGGFPVRARSGAWAYRARRFVSRNWVGVGAAATLVATLAGAAALLSIEQRATARERDRATREATNAGLVIDFLADVFRGRDPTQAPSDTLTARELLAWGTERVDAELGGRPDVHAELLTVLGQAHSNMGLTDEAIALHERSTRLRRELYGDTSAEVAEALDLLAGAHTQNRDFAAAHPLREEVLTIERAVGGLDSEGAGRALRRLAETNRDLGRLDEAEGQLREASAIHARTASADSSELVQDMLALAYVLRARDELDQAERLYEEAIPRYRATVGPLDTELATYLNNLAYLHRVRGDFAGAEPLYREALGIVNEVLGRGHPKSLMFANNLASALHELGRGDEVVALMRERVAAANEQWPDGHWRVGSAYRALGVVLLRLGRAADAEAPLEAAVASYTQTLGASHDWTAGALAMRAVGQVLTGREAEGRALLDRFHAGMQARARESDDGLDPASRDLVEPLVRVLDDTGLEDEAARFRALVPATGTPP